MRQWGGPEAPWPLDPAWLSAAFARGAARYFVLATADAGEVVGLFGARGLGSPAVHLIRVGLAPEWRGHGLARPLIRAAEALARDQGAERLTLNVYGDNEPARRAYESAGFFVHEFAADEGGDGDEIVRMLKPLGPAPATRGQPTDEG